MILPEIDHYFIELPLADNGACQLRRLDVADDPLCPPREVTQLWVTR
jgi:hypothetical protein